MKVGIKQPVLMDALLKGATAALSKSAQSDTSNLSILIQSIKMTADEESFSIESSTDLMAVKYVLPSSKDGGIIVQDSGSILIKAKELINWVKAQGSDSSITMTLNKLDTPEIINTLDEMDVSDSSDNFMIKKIGSLVLVSKDDKKIGSKWELECYEPDQVKSVEFSSDTPKSFEMRSEQLEVSLSKVLVAALDNDYEHVLDSISIQTYNNDLYFAATDTKRCALYKIPSDSVADIKSDSPMLIQGELLGQVSKIINKDENISFAFDDESEKVYMTQKNLKIRLASTEKDNINKFPNIKMLLEKEYSPLTSMQKYSLNKVLLSAALVNSQSALFNFNSEKETLTVKAISEDGKYTPTISNCEAPTTTTDVKVVWGVSHLIDGLKIIKSDEIELKIPENLRSVKVNGIDDDSLMYFAMSIDNPKYSVENE